jgi:lipopolysaccharide biosynthesis regulator YciM
VEKGSGGEGRGLYTSLETLASRTQESKNQEIRTQIAIGVEGVVEHHYYTKNQDALFLSLSTATQRDRTCVRTYVLFGPTSKGRSLK